VEIDGGGGGLRQSRLFADGEVSRAGPEIGAGREKRCGVRRNRASGFREHPEVGTAPHGRGCSDDATVEIQLVFF